MSPRCCPAQYWFGDYPSRVLDPSSAELDLGKNLVSTLFVCFSRNPGVSAESGKTTEATPKTGISEPRLTAGLTQKDRLVIYQAL